MIASRWPHDSGPARLGVQRALVAVSLAVGPATLALATEEDEFAAFRITDLTGSVSLRYNEDSSSIGSPLNGTAGSQQESRVSAAASVSSRSYFYHPNFVTLDTMFGVTGQRSRFDWNAEPQGSQTRAHHTLFDLSLRATFLADKPYTGSVYVEHLNPTVSIGPALVMLQQTTRLGAQASIRAPATPVPLSFEFDRTTATGRGGGRIVDDQTDRASLGADWQHGRMGNTQLRVDGMRTESSSGSAGLPISRAGIDTVAAGLDTRLQFGEGNRHRFSQLINASSQQYRLGADTPASRHEWRWYADLRSRHSPSFQTFTTGNAMRSDQGAVHTRTGTAAAGLTWLPIADLTTTLDGRTESAAYGDLVSSAIAAGASLVYQWQVSGGRAQVGYSARHEARAQESSSPATSVIGERHALTGTAPTALERQNVVPGSVRVFNESRTQTFVEGRDYELSLLGAQMRLLRIVTGDITDGQVVLTDYAFETGGTYATRQTDQAFDLSWAWGNRFSAYVRLIESAPRLSSGLPLLGLNPAHGRTYGVRADAPIGVLGSAGGSVEHERRREAILPFTRSSMDLFVQREDALVGQGTVRIGVRRNRVDYDQSVQDLNLTGWDLRYRLLTAEGVDLQADWSTERDVGAPIQRTRRFGTVQARWRYRQLQMTGSLTHVQEVQDGLRSTRTVGQWLLLREF